MTQYREILRLTALGLSQRSIIQSLGVSQKTIVKVQHCARYDDFAIMGVRTFSWTTNQSMPATDQTAMSPILLRY